MILRRLTEACRKQDWFTVLIETLIVVLGVFLGLQVNNWNEARSDRERAQQYLSRIEAELQTDIKALDRNADQWQAVADYGNTAIRYAETGELNGASEWEVLLAFLHASQSFPLTFVNTTYSELRSAGELSLLGDPGLQAALADYYVLVAARRGGDRPYGLLPKYRENIRGRMRSDIMGYYWSACYEQSIGIEIMKDCPPPEEIEDIGDVIDALSADQEIVDSLRYWVGEQRMAAELAGFDSNRAQNLIDRINAQ